MKNKSHGSWYYEQIDLGFNFRLNDLQSALGINQLKRLDSFVEERHSIVKKYDKLFEKNDNIITPTFNKHQYSSYHLYIIRVKKQAGIDRKVIFEKLRNEGIFVNVHYIPIYRQPYYSEKFDFKKFPNSEKYYSEAISIPIYPGLDDKKINRIYEIITTPRNHQTIF